MASASSKKSNKTYHVGQVVLLDRGLVGVVKYRGPLQGSEGEYLGVKLGEGAGECNGQFRGISYFTCPPQKGIFCQDGNVKRAIKAENLLDKVVQLNKKVKQQAAEISKLNDDLTLSKEQGTKAMKSMATQQPGSVGTTGGKELSMEQYLQRELNKKWYTTKYDFTLRYSTKKAEAEKVFAKFEKKFEDMQTHAAHSRIVYTVCASQKDNLIASGSDDKTIRLWRKKGTGENASSRCIAHIQLRSCINSLAFSPDGEILAAALDSGWIELYNLGTGKMIGALEGQTTSEVWTICFSPDGSNLISGALDRAVRIWDVRERECRWALRGHDEWVNGVAVSADGSTIVSGSGDKTVRIWDTKNMGCRSCLRGHTDFVRSVCVTEDSRHVVSASDDCQLRVWDLAKGVCRNVLAGHNKGIYSVAAGSGNYVASASRDATVKVWNIEETKHIQEYKGHRGDVNSCVFVDNGQYVCSGSDDKQVMIFPVQAQSKK